MSAVDVLAVMDRHVARNMPRGDADLIAARVAINDALTTLRMVERAWASGAPAYIDPESPLAQVKAAIAGLEGGRHD